MSNPIEGPLVRELREIAEGERDFPNTGARRHHFVPAFVLAEFAIPRGDRRSFMAQLETATGRPNRTTPNDSCFVKDLYAQQGEVGRDNTLEAFFSIVERHSAPALRRLVEAPLNQSPEDRETLSLYLAFQYTRSPVVLDEVGSMAETISLLMFGVHMEDAVAFRKVYREAVGAEASDEEIEAFRHDMKGMLARGELRMSDRKAQAFELMLSTADEVAETIHQMQWTIVEACEDEFVISDRALAIHDPSPRFPWSGQALRSSPDAQTVVPLSPEHVLILDDGPPRTGKGTADGKEVRRMNLLTYGWAERYIYGRNQAVVQRVRRQAKEYRREVIRPRPMRQIMLEAADPNDPNVGKDHVRRGWPRGLWVPGDDGQREFVAYTVVDTRDPKRAARTGAELGRRIIEGAVAEGLATTEHLGVDPDDAK